jgi:single-strand DNA-binding protein
MKGINTVIIIGRIGTININYLDSGMTILNLSVAVNNPLKRDETIWFNVSAFKRLAEHCANYLSKGSLISVVGSLQIDEFVNQENQNQTTFKINAKNIVFLSKVTNREDELMAA